MADVVANGVRFNVSHLGQGDQTVVFLHGLVMDNLSSFYYTLANPIAREAEVYLYDLRGHGRSERPPTGYTVEDSVADLDALLDVLEVDRPVYVVGNSFGGVVGLGMAVAHPDRVAGLALIEAHFAVEGWGHHMAGSLAIAAFGLAEDEVGEWLDQQGGRKINKMARNAESLIYDTTMLDDLEAVQPLPREALAALACPVLAFYGEHSDLLDRARDLEELVPDCDLRLLPGCTHSVLMEATAELKATLIPWINGDPVPAYPAAPEALIVPIVNPEWVSDPREIKPGEPGGVGDPVAAD